MAGSFSKEISSMGVVVWRGAATEASKDGFLEEGASEWMPTPGWPAGYLCNLLA